MRRHLALFAAVTVALGVLAVSPASALTKPQVFSLVDVSVSSTSLPPGAFDPNGPVPLGGRIAFTDLLYKWAGVKRGPQVGHLEGLCTATKFNEAARSETLFCNATAFLPA